MSDIGNTYIVSDNVYIRIISDCGKIYYAINDRILQCSSTRHIIFTNPIDGTEYIVDVYPGNYEQDHIINIPELDIWEIRTLNPIIDKYLTNCEIDLSQFENSFELFKYIVDDIRSTQYDLVNLVSLENLDKFHNFKRLILSGGVLDSTE